MRIAICTQHPFPVSHDHRCRKIAETLAAAGHEIVVYAPKAEALPGCWRGMPIQARAPRWPSALMKSLPLNPFWTLWLGAACARDQVQCILSKDLRLAMSALLAARARDISYWIDLAENYPAMVEVERSNQILMPIWKSAAGFIEKLCARWADLVTVVTESNRARLQAASVPAERIHVVSNTPRLSELAAPGRPCRPQLTLGFVGGLSKVRGLDRMLLAIEQARREGTAVYLDIVGNGPEEGYLKGLFSKLGLQDCVQFRGWAARERLPELIAAFDIGVIPHRVCEHTQTTIPNKLFDYMACAVPVLTTAMRPCMEVVQETGCGWIAEDSVSSLAATLHRIAATPVEERRQMGIRGQVAVREKYNWTVDGAKLLQSLRCVAAEHHGL